MKSSEVKDALTAELRKQKQFELIYWSRTVLEHIQEIARFSSSFKFTR
jgi:hypothetical protein